MRGVWDTASTKTRLTIMNWKLCFRCAFRKEVKALNHNDRRLQRLITASIKELASAGSIDGATNNAAQQFLATLDCQLAASHKWRLDNINNTIRGMEKRGF